MADESSAERPESREYGDDEVMAPSFRLAGAVEDEVPCQKLYMQAFAREEGRDDRWRSLHPDQWHLLATIFPSKLVMHPVYTNPHAQRYLSRRHGRIETLIYEDGSDHHLPQTPDEAVGQIATRLPWGLFNDCELGLGLVKELDPLWMRLHSASTSDTLVISHAGRTGMNGQHVQIAGRHLDQVRRRFNRLNRVGRENIKAAKGAYVRNEVLPQVDATRFPRVVVVQRNAQLVELRLDRSGPSGGASRVERQRSVEAVQNNLGVLAGEAPRELLQLHAAIERVTVERMIEIFERMLQQQLPENRWQRFFADNVFVLSLVFARPIRLLHTQFHARGSGLDGSGAQVGDFLLAEQGQAIAIVEIKKPSTDLMARSPYRNTEVFGPSADLGGAINQVLIQQSELRSQWIVHQGRPELRGSRSDAIKCVVIAGTMPGDETRCRCFEVFRNACKDVEVVTFDELLGKLRLLQHHLAPPSPEPPQDNAPF